MSCVFGLFVWVSSLLVYIFADVVLMLCCCCCCFVFAGPTHCRAVVEVMTMTTTRPCTHACKSDFVVLV